MRTLVLSLSTSSQIHEEHLALMSRYSDHTMFLVLYGGGGAGGIYCIGEGLELLYR